MYVVLDSITIGPSVAVHINMHVSLAMCKHMWACVAANVCSCG